jgi:hypothetical protein
VLKSDKVTNVFFLKRAKMAFLLTSFLSSSGHGVRCDDALLPKGNSVHVLYLVLGTWSSLLQCTLLERYKTLLLSLLRIKEKKIEKISILKCVNSNKLVMPEMPENEEQLF